MSDRLAVRKTYKLYVNGAFPRSESGRTYEVTDTKGHFLANAAWASRKDARDAVVAARGAFGKWAAMTAYNRGQVLYRVAEVMEGRHVQFCEEVDAQEGLSGGQGPRRRRRRHRPLGLVRRVDRQARRRPRWREPGRRPVLRLLDARADRRRRRPGAAAVVPARPGERARAGPRRRQHHRAGDVEGAPAACGHPRRGAGDQRRPRWRGQPAHRRRRASWARGWPSTPTSTAST